jgi:hypothetical protein
MKLRRGIEDHIRDWKGYFRSELPNNLKLTKVGGNFYYLKSGDSIGENAGSPNYATS